MALALTILESSKHAGCGQDAERAFDPDLVEEWTTMHGIRCGACTALARAAERDEKRDHPHALSYVVGLRSGWEGRKATLVAEREAREAQQP